MKNSTSDGKNKLRLSMMLSRIPCFLKRLGFCPAPTLSKFMMRSKIDPSLCQMQTQMEEKICYPMTVI